MSLLYFKQHFDTEEVILQQRREQVLYFYSTMATKYSWSFSSLEERSRSTCDVILKQNWLESCFLLHPRDFRSADNWFSFCKGICFIFSSPEPKALVMFSVQNLSIVRQFWCHKLCFIINEWDYLDFFFYLQAMTVYKNLSNLTKDQGKVYQNF